MFESLNKVINGYGLISGFAIIGVTMAVSYWLSARLTRGRLHGSAIAIFLGMVSSGVGHALLPKRIEAVYENRVRLIPLQPRYRLQQHIGVVFLKAKERDPNLLALLAECRMYSLRLEQEAAG